MNQIKTKRLVLKKPTKKINKKLIVSKIGDWEVAKWLSDVPYPYTEQKAEEWLNNINENLKKTIEKMKNHEKEHLDFFNKEIKKRNIKPTKLLPLWDLLGVGLGFSSAIIGKKATMLCTASVEEVIDEHYQNQINELDSNEKVLKEKIKKFRDDELHHRDIAYEQGASKKGLYAILDKIIKTGSKVAINISEKI